MKPLTPSRHKKGAKWFHLVVLPREHKGHSDGNRSAHDLLDLQRNQRSIFRRKRWTCRNELPLFTRLDVRASTFMLLRYN